MEHIDVIFYINLAHRTDRLAHIQVELQKLCQDSAKIYRIEATYNKENGALGCAYSHVEALEKFQANTAWNTCLILEDDFQFLSSDISENNSTLREIIQTFPDWQAISLAYNPSNIESEKTHHTQIVKVCKHQMTTGYLIKRGDILPNLIKVFKKSIFNLKKLQRNLSIYNIDQIWKDIQPKYNWYTTYPPIGISISDYSDICKMDVKYDIFDTIITSTSPF